MNIYPAHFFAAEYPPHDPARRATIDDMDTGETMTNAARAADAAGRLPFYYQHTEEESYFSDLITNILHLAHSQKMDPADIIKTALMNFHAEAGPILEAPAGWDADED